jgi:hypothetical protein
LGGQKFDADDNDYANVILLPMPMWTTIIMPMPILSFLADGGLEPWQPQVSGNRYQLGYHLSCELSNWNFSPC